MQDIQAQVISVGGRSTKNGKTIYDVALSDGQKYTTFDITLANKANALTGQQASARVDVKQNGQYTNYNLEDIAPLGQLAAQALQPGTAIPVAGQASAGAIPITQGSNGGGMSPERERKIVIQSSLSTAATLVGALYEGTGPEALAEAEEHVLRVARGFFNIVFDGSAAGEPVPATVPATPAEVAAQVNAEAGAAVVQPGSAVQW